MQDTITFYYSPQTRARSVAMLLDELQAPHELHVLNMKAGENRQPPFLAINPLGKVPTIRHGDAVVTEQLAIHIYLGDLFPQAGLTPAITDPLRGPYLRWMAYFGACFEPALIDAYLKREPAHEAMSPYGTYDQVIEVIRAQLAKGDYLLGDTFTVADVLWGTGIGWTLQFGLIPKLPEFEAYARRVSERPSYKRISEMDAAYAAEHEAALAAASAG
ncbi:glutathione S-transferase family protein [Roseibium suaedae]|uniref:Glutathione S-transferase n=1 Tax=Roseibium suaedae TaxID=735517 RepID=A0A1M7FMI5_9HYPH|nr:glutathione S-transferase family protein [Roseibium suaedae]SHM04847.1 glutathione S-transferase [Roseibium suaedae]